jgi:hypothetical protein
MDDLNGFAEMIQGGYDCLEAGMESPDEETIQYDWLAL